MYHPLPLNMMAGAEISLPTDFPHRAQVATGSSFMLCFNSNLYEQSWHRYS
jgi:hypothetical protein